MRARTAARPPGTGISFGSRMRLRAASSVRLLAAASLAAAIAFGAAVFTEAGETTYGEYQMKAAFIKNFVKFIDWPSRPSGNLTLCILGEDPFRDALVGPDDVGGGRSLSYRRIGKLKDADGCQLLFVPQNESHVLPEILATLAGREVLTIGDGEGLAQGGLMIGFLLEEQKVRFVANLEPVRRAGLTISSRLLGLAKTVYNPR
jgi:hypothetical protein